MRNTLGLSVVAAALVLLAGCATVTQPPAGPAVPQPGVQAPPAAPPPAQQPPGVQPPPGAAAAPVMIEPLQRAEMSQNRAVVALLDRAQSEADAGKPDAAGASLERALHIEPRNPWVWQQLAQMRLNAGRYDQAISLARKSNSFSGGKRLVQAVNWQLIAKARVAKGDAAGADEAFKKAADLAELAKAERPMPGFAAPAPVMPAPIVR
jgi:tetratricopeptide (TPR) repeat protein